MDLNIPRLVLDGIQIVGSLVDTHEDLKEAFQFAAERKANPKVTRRPLKDINAIFTEIKKEKITGHMVIVLSL